MATGSGVMLVPALALGTVRAGVAAPAAVDAFVGAFREVVRGSRTA